VTDELKSVADSFKVLLFLNLNVGTEEDHGEPQAGLLAFGLRFEPGIFLMRSRGAIITIMKVLHSYAVEYNTHCFAL